MPAEAGVYSCRPLHTLQAYDTGYENCSPSFSWKYSPSEHPSVFLAVLSIGPGTRQSSGRYSVESRRVYLTFKNSPERNSPGLLILLWQVLFQGSQLLQILLKALFKYLNLSVLA